MAEEVVEKVDEQLNCTICLDTYTNPKILQCFHVYCQKCLVKLVDQDQQGQHSLSCPICRQVTPVPDSGTEGLQSAFHINRLLEILYQHKKAKAESSASAERVDIKAESPSYSTVFCSGHGREVELFCETCEKLLCMKCIIKGGKHHSHNYEDIGESFEKYREKITPSLKPLEKQLTTIPYVLIQLDRNCEEITNQQAAMKAEIQASSKRLQELISKRQEELICQLEQVTRRKLKRLATQRDQIETLQAQLSGCLEFTRESLKPGIEQREVLVMKSRVLKQVLELTTASRPEIFTLSADADMIFSVSADTAAVCENYGRVYAPDLPNPSSCTVTGGGTKVVLGEKVTAVLQVVNFKGQPCHDSLVSMEVMSEIGGRNVEHTMIYRGQGQYVTRYQPTVKGRHQLHITVDNEHINGSPFIFPVEAPLEKLGTQIMSLCYLGAPRGVAVTGKGEVVIAEGGADCVSVFSPCGKKIRSFGKRGSDKGQLNGPSGVAVDREGNLLVADRKNHRIQKYTVEGHFLCEIGSKGKGTLQFNEPGIIVYSARNNKIYISDTWNHRVHILNFDLSSNGIFGRKGSGKGQFDHPHGVAIDSTGTVYVADSRNNRIQVFTAEGKFLRMFGKGINKGSLTFPIGVAVDASGLVYVSEYSRFRVSLFTSEGVFVLSFGAEGGGPGRFQYPRGLAVDDSGVVYVCDSGNDRVQVF